MDAGADAGAAALTAVTFNAGLLDSVGYVEERAPHVVTALGGLEADLVCAQELWQKEHWDAVVEASQAKRPHVLRFEARPGVSGKCTPDEFAPLRACAAASCSDVGASGLTACTTEQCGDEVAALSSACIGCLLDNVSSGDFDAIAAACVGATGSSDGGAPPPDERAYLVGGSYGTGLLSALPFVETDKKELDASTNRRGILYAEIDVPKLGMVHVFCSHLAPILKDVKYEGSYGSWEAENAAHVKTLIEWADEKAGADGQVLLLGDFNTGPSGEGIRPSVPDSYAQLPDAGFGDPFLSGPNAACTFCSDNPLVSPDDAAADADIDHIMPRGLSDEVSATANRIFDSGLEITTRVPAGGQDGGTGDAGTISVTKQVSLSDHYGVRTIFRP